MKLIILRLFMDNILIKKILIILQPSWKNNYSIQ